jgi:hypothetical protein
MDRRVLIFSEDACVRIVDSMGAAVVECEGIDVASQVFWFFDADGRPLVPVFDDPKFGKRFLWFELGDPSRYHLVRGDEQHPMFVDPLWVSLLEAVNLEPNPYYKDLDALKEDLRSRGIQVDQPE